MQTIRCKDIRKNIAVSILTVALLLELLWIFCPINFETNDDTGIMGYLAGFKIGTPTASSLFCYYLWGKLVSTLYFMTGSLPWYTLIYIVLVFLALTTICFDFITLMAERGIPLFVAVAAYTFLFLAVFCYYSSAFQFTTISALCGAACIANVFTSEYMEDKYWRAANYALTFIFYMFAYNIRPKVGELVLAALLFAVVMNRYVMHRLHKRTVIVYVVLLSGIIGASYSINAIYEYALGWQDFREYHVERATYTDYPKVGYLEDPELYHSIGWSENLATLVGQWFFMDEKVTVDSFRVLNNAKKEQNINLADRFQEVKRLLFQDKAVCMQEAMWFLLLVFFSYSFYKKRRWRNILEAWGYFIVFWIASIYFAYNERLPLRVYESVVYLFLIPCIFSIVMSLEWKAEGKEFYVATIIGLSAVIMVLLPVGMWNKAYFLAQNEERKASVLVKSKVENYAIGHLDNVYIYDISMIMSGDPFAVYPDVKPYNLLFWGGSGCYSPLYYTQLGRNGLSELYPENFFADNVYFIGRYEAAPTLYHYMAELYPDCTCSIVETTDDFIVYKFMRAF